MAQRERSHGGRASGDGVLLPATSLWLTALGRGSVPSMLFPFPGSSFVARLAWQGAASLVVPGRVPVTSSYSSMPSRAAHDEVLVASWIRQASGLPDEQVF